MAGVIAITLLVPFASKLPFTFQRSLAFLPLKLNAAARSDAEDTEDWRLQIWKDALPTVPQHLLLGKGYALSQGELTVASSDAFHYSSDIQSVDIVGSYHSGPLSVVIPFGIWGVIALLAAGLYSMASMLVGEGEEGVRLVETAVATADRIDHDTSGPLFTGSVSGWRRSPHRIDSPT